MRLRSSDEIDSVSILEETLIDSSPKKEVLEKKSGFLDLNVLDSGLNEEITSMALEMDVNAKVESVVEEDDGDVKVINVFGNILMDEDISDVDGETKKIKDEEDGESDGSIRAKKGKRGRKRKVVGSSEKVKVENDGVRVSSRVLRSSVKMTSGSAKVDESRLNESVVGFKRQMKVECFDPTELDMEVDDKSQASGRLNKKQKLHRRPPKTQGEIDISRKILDENDVEQVDESTLLIGKEQKKQKRRGRPPKTQGEIGSSKRILDEHDVEEVDERTLLIGKEQKKQKRCGRPPKMQSEIGSRILDENDVEEVDERALVIGEEQKKQKRLGRPPKMHSETGLSTTIKSECLDDNDVEEVDESNGNQQKKQKRLGRDLKVEGKNLKCHGKWPKAYKGKPKAMVVKMNNSQLKSEVAVNTPKICNVQNEDGSSEITGDNTESVKISEENNAPTTAEDTDKNNNTLKLKNSIGGADSRRMEQQLVRDRIVSMIIKAGWTIEYRPRQNRQYLDAVYVDQKGKTHWSVTKAYFSLKSKIEKGVACNEEVSAFTSISNEELSVLFRSVSKVRSDKDIKKKKKKKEKNQCKAEIIITGVAQLKSHKKKLDKENKEKKAIQKSANRGPKVTQKDRQGRKPRLLARSTSKGLNQDNDDSALYSGKRNLLSWLIDSGVIIPGSKLHYGESRLRSGLLEGTVNVDGIQCNCCNEIMDISRFVSHGGGKDAQGLEKISLPSGSSLIKCLLEAWRKEEESSSIKFNYVSVDGDDPSDDTCNFCGDGGDLICCDGCPSTFHQSCLDIQNFPSGDWHCVYCSCKFCGLVVRGAAQMDDSHQPNSEMLACLLCEEKFHHTCLQEDAAKVDSSILSFCGRKCQEIHERLQAYLGLNFELEDGFSWTLLKRSDVSQVAALLDDKQKVECNSKLAVAFSVMDECFVPIMDERSGVNRIHNVVYNCGSNFRRLDYSGFFTAILERGGELISVASIRIHGHQLAEMPFIGTRDIYRRQGMCRRLLDAIEQALSTLGVGKLIIPAIPELFKTWTKVFGFKPLEESQRQEMKCMSMIVFPGTDMLQKPLLDNQSADKNLSLVAETADAVPGSSGDITHEHNASAMVNNSVDSVRMSPLTLKGVSKITFDLNLQPAATDADTPFVDDDDCISKEPQVCKSSSEQDQVCKSSFELSDSSAQHCSSFPTPGLICI
uniref:uncharacterized protein LOC122592101 n=1 Tax=Erigeron canadensis TaxID=72917 RepID=UPI001CB9B0B7|nr:uncharacterized protein LOC122592101 [Erigeron canadensis]